MTGVKLCLRLQQVKLKYKRDVGIRYCQVCHISTRVNANFCVLYCVISF